MPPRYGPSSHKDFVQKYSGHIVVVPDESSVSSPSPRSNAGATPEVQTGGIDRPNGDRFARPEKRSNGVTIRDANGNLVVFGKPSSSSEPSAS